MMRTEPTLAERLLQEHEVVRQIIHQLELLVEEGGLIGQDADWGRRLCTELAAFRQHLQRHFALEEEGGFLLDVVTHLPQATERVENLRREHREILQVIDELIHDSNLLAYGTGLPLVKFRHQILQVLSTIRRHEADENALVQRVFYQEVSVAD
jgi:hemerythrin-like domain-containing protein